MVFATYYHEAMLRHLYYRKHFFYYTSSAPFVSIAAQLVKKLEKKDTYDYKVTYNPFLYNTEFKSTPTEDEQIEDSADCKADGCDTPNQE